MTGVTPLVSFESTLGQPFSHALLANMHRLLLGCFLGVHFRLYGHQHLNPAQLEHTDEQKEEVGYVRLHVGVRSTVKLRCRSICATS